VNEEVEHLPPLEILAELRLIEQEIQQGIEELEGVLR
jgi:type I restriction enzyme M protein